MNEIDRLLAALDALARDGEQAVMATVVKVEGSAYRRPGARMLIARHGGTVGTVSGGCLEGELARRAWWLTEAGEPVLRTYRTGIKDGDADEEEALAFGLGCNGTVRILLERLDNAYLPARLLRQVRDTQHPAVLATVIDSNLIALPLGLRACLDAQGIRLPAGLHGVLAERLADDLRHLLTQRRNATQVYTQAGRQCEVLFEYLAPAPRLVLFGAGHDAQPLVRMAAQQGWQVSVVDARSHFARRERFPEAREVLHRALETAGDLSDLLEGAAVVVMSHSLSQDRHWLGQALAHGSAYIGQLGPRERTERLLGELGARGERVHYPMGLDIGAEGPEAVALSVLAEITACFNRRDGRPLRQRSAPIHDALGALRD
ncbi:XdhC family protein [Pseudomonas entomophila]|uniref:XdhC family protein n=1 Tax=Pseudomonas entomophila TaxID=312306 RepID=UPI0023D81A3C|nr:XdhC/CoxI family protein [Pseudomonas entomophila]MDF0731808.1 XdhC family protein [Pseudomonas entomophila]